MTETWRQQTLLTDSQTHPSPSPTVSSAPTSNHQIIDKNLIGEFLISYYQPFIIIILDSTMRRLVTAAQQTFHGSPCINKFVYYTILYISMAYHDGW